MFSFTQKAKAAMLELEEEAMDQMAGFENYAPMAGLMLSKNISPLDTQLIYSELISIMKRQELPTKNADFMFFVIQIAEAMIEDQ